VLGLIAAVALLLRRYVHPVVALLWTALLVVILLPVLVLGVAIQTLRWDWRDWRNTARTAALGTTWAAALVLVYGAITLESGCFPVPIPLAIAAWIARWALAATPGVRLQPAGPGTVLRRGPRDDAGGASLRGDRR
jgi:hypothetical protein